jgi:lysophospholipase-3
MNELSIAIVGDDLGAYLLPSHTLRGQQMTSPSTAWLLPSNQFWDPDETLVELPWKGNMTVNHYKDFFDAMNYQAGYEMRKDTENLLKDLPHPGVEVHCLYGSGVSTVER